MNIDTGQRKRNKPDEDDDNINNDLTVIIHGLGNKPMRSYNPNTIHRCVTNIIESYDHINVLRRSGDLRLQCLNFNQVNKMLTTDCLQDGKNNIPVSCSLAANGNNRMQKCVIRNVPFDLEDSEILTALENQCVVSSKRFTFMRDGIVKHSASVLLTFSCDKLPDYVNIHYLRFPLTKYNPPPLQCYHCNGYGHIAATCRYKLRCKKCGESHDYKTCENQLKCCNCGQSHSAAYRGCVKYKEQVLVKQLVRKNHTSYSDAIKAVRQQKITKSYEFNNQKSTHENISPCSSSEPVNRLHSTKSSSYMSQPQFESQSFLSTPINKNILIGFTTFVTKVVSLTIKHKNDGTNDLVESINDLAYKILGVHLDTQNIIIDTDINQDG